MSYGLQWETDELNETLTVSTRPQPPAFYISAHTVDPGVNGAVAGEVSGGGYTRKQVTSGLWTLSTVGDHKRATLNTDVVWATASANYGGGSAISWLGFWKAATGTASADFIGRHNLATPKTVSTGQKLRIQANNLTITHGGT